MIEFLRRIWFAVKEAAFLRLHTDRAARFGAIYRNHMWKNPESASGFGSTIEATTDVRDGLARLIASHGVCSILDAPCGDFNWMRAIAFEGSYLGLDIVPELIASNLASFGDDRRAFQVADIVADPLPSTELVLCRDCLNHLPLGDGVAALRNLKSAAAKLLVITHFPSHPANREQSASFRYRALNLTLPPFSLGKPNAIIEESHGSPGKCLAVWEVSNRPIGT